MSYVLVSLNSQQLGDLARILWIQETEIIKSRAFDSTIELNAYLEDCGIAYDYVGKIQTAAGDLNAKWKPDAIKGPIAVNIQDYVEKALNTGLQVIRNYGIRKTFLEKLSDHTDCFIAALDQLDSKDTCKVNDLNNDVINYRDSMANCMENYYHGNTSFAQWVKDSGMSFQDLVARYQSEVGYAGDFKELPEEQKLQVYEQVIRVFGKGNIFKTDYTSKAGVGFLVLMAGMMVWDIFTSNHQISVAVRTTMDNCRIIGAVVRPLLVFFLGSGGELNTTAGIQCQIAELPDGATLANQIWSEDQQK